MKKHIRCVLCVLVALTLLPVPAFAGEDTAHTSDESITVIVEVTGDAVLESRRAAELGYREYLETAEAKVAERTAHSVQSTVQAEIEDTVQEDTPLLFTYTHIFNGFAMKVREEDIDKIRALPHVKRVYRDHEYTVPAEEPLREVLPDETSGAGSGLIYGSEMMHLSYLHERGFTGKGMVIAIVDSAFDVNHIMFSEPVAGPRLSKSDIASLIQKNSLSVCASGASVSANRVYRSEKIPFAFNYNTLSADTYFDLSNHGTHVAGIAAGNHGIDLAGNTFVGAAPDAQLLLMACSTGKNASSLSRAALLAGMEDAVKLGADVINCSFGSAHDYSEAPEIQAVDRARSAGITVSVAAGNSGRGGGSEPIPAELIDYGTLPEPADISAATSVASADSINRMEAYDAFEASGEEFRYQSLNTAVPFRDTLKDAEYAYVYAGKGQESDFESSDASGKLAIVEPGDIPWRSKVLNAQNAGAVGVLILYRSLSVSMSQDKQLRIPVAVLSETNREALVSAEEKRITVPGQRKVSVIHTDTVKMSSFSSWITERELELKPELTAPGGNIYSSVNDDTFRYMSGTSMAAPFLSGTAAVLMEYMAANPERYAKEGNRATLLENLLMSTADVVMEDADAGIPCSPRLQGAGLANAEKAVKTPVILLGDRFTANGETYRKSKISLREIAPGGTPAFSLSFTARNLTDTPVTYDRLSMKVLTDAADENGYVAGMRELPFSDDLPQSVTVPAGGETELHIAVDLDPDELCRNMEVFKNGFYMDGYVFLESADADIPGLHIPFTGFYGDWGAQNALDGSIFEDNILGESYLYTLTKQRESGAYGTDYEESILGYHRFDPYNDEHNGSEYAGISPDFDGEADRLLAVFKPLRMVGKTDFAICDLSGNELAHKVDESEDGYFYARKRTSSFLSFDLDVLSDLPDGDYVFEIRAGFLYREPYEQDEILKMPFYIDREAPEITHLSVDEDSGTMHLSLKDNRYLMGVTVSGISNGMPRTVVYPIAPQKEYETDIDISAFLPDSVTVEAVDYAYNRTVSGNSPPEFEYLGRSGTEFVFTAYNRTGGDIPCTLLLGAYRKGCLVGLTQKKETLKPGTSHKYLDLDCGAYDTLKLFIWENLGNKKPVCRSFEF